jgi:hypothetical protein
MQPVRMRLLGAMAPSRPNARAGMKYGTASALAAVARNCLRVMDVFIVTP